jgi:hypothetical protein
VDGLVLEVSGFTPPAEGSVVPPGNGKGNIERTLKKRESEVFSSTDFIVFPRPRSINTYHDDDDDEREL